MAYLVICLCFGLAGGVVGRIKGSSFLIWFTISAVVPFIGLLVAIVYRYESNEPLRHCPRCRHPARIYDALCTRCGEELSYPPPEEIIEPSPQLRMKPQL